MISRERERQRDTAAATSGEPEFARFELDGQEYGVVAFSLDPPSLPDALTAAEADVARAILAGASSEQIAALRGSSRRTVEHQIESLFRKLGVFSRTELRRKLVRARSNSGNLAQGTNRQR